MDSKHLNIQLKNYLQEYKIFKDTIQEKIKINKEKGKDNLNKYIDDKDLKLSFIFFSYIKQNLLDINIGNINENNIKDYENFNIIMNFAENSIKEYKYHLIYYWHHYLIISLINEIKLILKEEDININTLNINRFLYLFEKNNDIINILYKNNKIKLEQVFSLSDIYLIWIEENNINNNIIYDKYYKLKNYFLFKSLFNLLEKIFKIELNEERSKDGLEQIFNYLEKLSLKINKNFINTHNNTILLNNTSFSDFIVTLLKNMDINTYKKYKDILINFYKIIIKDNFNQSKIIEKMINNIKESFLNLSVIDKEKNSKKIIENNLFIQNFYFELMYNLFEESSTNENADNFNYNGKDSKISFKIFKKSLINTIFIFSFCLKVDNINKSNDKLVYPLLTIYNESKNSNIFKLFIKINPKEKILNLYAEEEGNKNLIFLNKLPFIKYGIIYHIILNIEEKIITIYLNKKSHEIKNLHFSYNENTIIQYGYDKISKGYFKGTLGNLVILKSKEQNKVNSKILPKLLLLVENNPYFLYSGINETIYNFDYIEFFNSYNSVDNKQIDEKSFNRIMNELKNNLECILYLTPFIIECYSNIQEDDLDKYCLPLVPDICVNQKYYIISDINISIIKHGNIPINFLMNNGLYFIFLTYEYFYQLSINLYKNKINKNLSKFLLQKDNKELINNILINTIKIMTKYSKNILNFYGVFKMIFYNLFNCIKSFNLLNNEIIHNSVIKNFGNLVVMYVYDINSINNMNNINKNDQNKLIKFRDGLIDFLLSSELYTDNDLNIIKYILSLIYSLNKEQSQYTSIFVSNKNLLWKILSIIQLLESLFVDNSSIIISDNNNIKFDKKEKNSMNQITSSTNIQTEIFNLLKFYFLNIKPEENSHVFFSDLVHYCISNNKNNYYLIYNYLYVIYELICNEYYLENNEIQILMDYLSELIKKNNDINDNDNENEYNIINDKNDNLNNIIKDNDREIKEKIICIILRILIDLIFSNYTDKKIKENMLDLIKNIEINNEIINNICKEIDKLFSFLLNINNQDYDTKFRLYINTKKKIDSSKIYNRLFNFIIAIFKSINNNKSNYHNNIKINLINEIFSLLISISKKIGEEFKSDILNKEAYISLLSYIIFLNKIIFCDILNNFNWMNMNIFILNISELVYLCQIESFLYTTFFIKLKINDKYYEKTIIEIILDIYINILMNDKFMNSHNLIFQSLNNIFDNLDVDNKKHTIFYYIDYIMYKSNKKNLNKKERKIMEDLNKINHILMKDKKQKEKFEMSFTTFSLLKISSYLKFLEKFVFKTDHTLKKYLESYIQKLLEEHKDLYKLNKNIFSKISKNSYYNQLKNIIETNYISKSKNKNNNNIKNNKEFQEFVKEKLKVFDDPISEVFTSENCNTNIKINKSNINNNIHNPTSRFSLAQDYRKLSMITDLNLSPRESKKSLKLSPCNTLKEKNFDSLRNRKMSALSNNKNNLLNMEYQNIDEDDKIDFQLNINGSYNIIENNKDENNDDNINKNNININFININDYELIEKIKPEINLSEHINSLYYFEDIDNHYIKNVKKEIMNNIFSIYFIDELYYNELFLKLKYFYLNEYKNVPSGTKMLNYPSKYKNYNNGLEPGIFLKKHSDFFNSKYFPISHPYFIEYMKSHNIYYKSIKLSPKKLPNTLINLYINKDKSFCELIKIDRTYFGQLLCFNLGNQNKYLIFQEKEFKLECEKEDIFDSIDNYIYVFSLTFLTYLDKIKKNNKLEINKQNKKRKRYNKLIIILFSEIEEIVERRFLFMWQGVEIYLKNGKSYFFNLFSVERKENFLNIFKNDEKLNNLIHTKDFLIKEKDITKEWRNYHLSTYEYLLLLNKYCSRTFNDNGQYPVFPWILMRNYDKIEEINSFDDNNNNDLIEKYFLYKGDVQNIEKKIKDLFNSIRKMKYPVCIQTEEKKRDLIDKYLEEEADFKFHLGIHYSTSSYIYYYLMRQEPYSDLLIKLQNYQQENPNRMFIGIVESVNVLEKSKDSREIIPELFSHFEYLLNLNCIFFGIKNNGLIVDDNLVDFFKEEKNTNPFYKYVNFIIEHRKLLNSKIISITINDWIDNIYGINQLPQKEKIRETSCNIFMKSTYAQEVNLQEKLNKYLDKIKNENNEDNKKNIKIKLFKKLISKINALLNFGQTPYQIFKEKHEKRNLGEGLSNELNNENNEDEEDEGFEVVITNCLKTLELHYDLKEEKSYIYFEINSISNKIYIISEERFIEILNTKLYNTKKLERYYYISPFNCIQLPYFLFNDKIVTGFGFIYYIYNIKYAFSSFDDFEETLNYDNVDTEDQFRTYGRKIIENIIMKKEKEKNIEKKIKTTEIDEEYFKFITCRYIDKSFKIHRFAKNKKNKNKNDIYKPLSFICEDFVSSCCAISSAQFLIGLKNGKLIQFYIEQKKEIINKDNKDNNNNELFHIKMEKYIQAHKGKINVIEINKKLGLIVTCGDDNYILIRKLYDFELLSPIKIKKKYIITMAKISPLNYLYIICYNKDKKASIIFGYTLTGLKFAKSDYGFYDNIDFTMNGNIITLKNHMELCILSGSKLSNVKMNIYDSHYEDYMKKCDIIKNAVYLRFNYFIIEIDSEKKYIKIITYYKAKENKLSTLNVSENKYFD